MAIPRDLSNQYGIGMRELRMPPTNDVTECPSQLRVSQCSAARSLPPEEWEDRGFGVSAPASGLTNAVYRAGIDIL